MMMTWSEEKSVREALDGLFSLLHIYSMSLKRMECIEMPDHCESWTLDLL